MTQPKKICNPVVCQNNQEDVNKAIALPVCLKADDGREFRITSWETTSRRGDVVRVVAELIVALPADDRPEVQP